MPSRRSHPGRHTDALSLRCGDHPGMNLGIDGDGELRGRVTTRHEANYTTIVGGSQNPKSRRRTVINWDDFDRADSMLAPAQN